MTPGIFKSSPFQAHFVTSKPFFNFSFLNYSKHQKKERNVYLEINQNAYVDQQA